MRKNSDVTEPSTPLFLDESIVREIWSFVISLKGYVGHALSNVGFFG